MRRIDMGKGGLQLNVRHSKEDSSGRDKGVHFRSLQCITSKAATGLQAFSR